MINMGIQQLRRKIDKIDQEIVALIARRISLVKEIAKVKQKQGLDIFDKEREKEIMNNITLIAKNNCISNKFIKKIFKEILNYSKNLQEGMLYDKKS